MAEKNSGASSSGKGGGKRRAAAGAGLGLTAAGLIGASSADAAQLVGDVAASDNRLFIILGLFLPALGWVLFNMAVSLWGKGEQERIDLVSERGSSSFLFFSFLFFSFLFFFFL